MVGRLEESHRQFNEVSRLKILLLNDLVTKNKKNGKSSKTIVRNHSTEKCTRISLNVFGKVCESTTPERVLKQNVKVVMDEIEMIAMSYRRPCR